jgi:hypothetical protein
MKKAMNCSSNKETPLRIGSHLMLFTKNLTGAYLMVHLDKSSLLPVVLGIFETSGSLCKYPYSQTKTINSRARTTPIQLARVSWLWIEQGENGRAHLGGIRNNLWANQLWYQVGSERAKFRDVHWYSNWVCYQLRSSGLSVYNQCKFSYSLNQLTHSGKRRQILQVEANHIRSYELLYRSRPSIGLQQRTDAQASSFPLKV